MPAAESEKKDDSYPSLDYSPHSDRDFSDFQSDIGWSSSEESIYSISPNPVDEGRRRGRSMAKQQSSLPTDKVAKKSPAADRKTFTEAVVLPTSNKKGYRVYDRMNYCLFCSKPLSKMARHFEQVHSDKAEVAVAFQHPMNSRERRKVYRSVFVHNKDILKTGKGLLAIHKRPHQPGRPKDFLHCLYCPEKVKNISESQFRRKRVAVCAPDLGRSRRGRRF
ncbi:uncharacterized protein LOC118313664 isoform X2 [Scophthalmus maximus]|uniref:uncharacterized protein LOC118313664 isoform X2 n=1 Tax=Scophthalmus maximus TaxID=52904 RepID=UPI001FA8AA60|nr:uncharacterized protein LOC118313664 isoform X2 [Scophthalmus maximus]